MRVANDVVEPESVTSVGGVQSIVNVASSSR